MAGATARYMLLAAAAEQLGVPIDELSTEAGTISHAASGQTLGYGDVASAAGGIEVPEEIELKDPKDYKIIGTRVKNVDGKKLVTGQPLFGLDVDREGMLIAMIVHPPAFGMKLKSFDASSVTGMPGIRDVFEINTWPDGFEPTWSDRNAFPRLVAIVGDTTWQVMQAQKAIVVEWERESPAESSAGHDELMSTLLANPSDAPSRTDGNPEEAFANAATVLERTYSAPFLAHNTLEPMNFFAHVTDEYVELEGPIQTPENMHKSAAAVLGMEEDQVSIMLTRMGGGFGRRLYGNFVTEAALISQKVKAPVKLVYTREDDMTQGTYRPAYKVTYRAALDAQNNITGFHVRGVGADGSPVYPNRYPAGTIDNYMAERLTQDTNISTGAWRAPRSNFIAFAEQSFLDELAETIGKDPIDLRLELFERAKTNPVGEENDYDADRYAGVLELVREKSNWDTPRSGVHRGVSAYYCHNSYVAQVVDVVMRDDKPHIQKIWCAVDCGIVINKEGATNQIEGGMVDGIGHAMYSAMTFTDGRPDQANFDSYRMIKNPESPDEIEVFFVDNGIAPTGLGEPSLPPVAAALANALYKATGERFYSQPFTRDKDILG